MKFKLQTYVRSVAVLLALTLLFSLVFAALYYFHAVSTSTFHIMNWIGGIIAYGVGGALLGIGVNKKALFHALPVAAVFYLLSLLLSGFSLPALLENLSKALVYVAAAVIAFSRTHKG